MTHFDRSKSFLNRQVHGQDAIALWKRTQKCSIASMSKRFSLIEDFIGSFRVLWLRHPDGRALAILPQAGAAIHRLQLPAQGKAHDLLVPMRTQVEIQRNRWAKSAHLLPFPNRVHRGAYVFDGKPLQLPVNFRPNGGHAIHGFAMSQPWEVVATHPGQDSASLTLRLDCPHGQEGYPFTWRAELELELNQDGFRMETRLINRGRKSMPAGWGWHPYFRTGTKIDALELQLPKARKLKVDEWMIPTGQYEAFPGFSKPAAIGDRFLDACLELEDTAGMPVCHLLDRAQGLKLSVSQEAATSRYLQVFTHPNRHGIALEPMSCAPDAFNNGLGLQVLEPKASLTTACQVSLSAL